VEEVKNNLSLKSMYISSISIKNFRSIEKIEIDLNQFNVFVGQNNHGKTNFFEAIDWFYGIKYSTDEVRRRGSGSYAIEVIVTFEDVEKGIERMKNKTSQTKIRDIVDGSSSAKIRRIYEKDDKGGFKDKREIFDPRSSSWKSPTGFSSSINDFLPRLQFIKTENSLKEVSKYGKKTEIGQMLSGVINEILQSEDKEYKEFVEKFQDLFIGDNSKVSKELKTISDSVRINLQKQFPECTDVSFEVKEPLFDDLLKNFITKVDDGFETTAEEKGDGMQRALMLAIIQTFAEYRKKHEQIKDFIFLVDEAELHLHPTAQRSLKNALLELAEGDDQVLISTHSSVLISDEKDIQSIYQVQKEDHKTQIEKLDQSEKQDLVYSLLGGHPSDLLLPSNFLVVEGRSEYIFLERVVERFYPEMPNIKILYAEGDEKKQVTTMDGINQVFKPLYDKTEGIYTDKMIILCDGKKQESDWKRFKSAYKNLFDNSQIFIQPESDLECCYPNPWKMTKEELIKVKGQKKLKTNLAIKVANKITKEQFESDMKITFDALKKCWSNAFKTK
jgi:putative ATP-dependent endonuclease of OLD family